MFIVFVAYVAVTVLICLNAPDFKNGLIVGVPLSFLYAMVSFFYKRVRSVMSIWWGILSLLTCFFWIYLLSK